MSDGVLARRLNPNLSTAQLRVTLVARLEQRRDRSGRSAEI